MSAIISNCGRYRYRLDRDLAPRFLEHSRRATVIMVNPSTADAHRDDATIRKLYGFGVRLQWSALTVGNLFAWRATDVRELARAEDPVGPENDAHLRRMIAEADVLIFAWGSSAKLPAALRGRARTVYAMATELGIEPQALGPVCRDGSPPHPLLLPYAADLQTWRPA